MARKKETDEIERQITESRMFCSKEEAVELQDAYDKALETHETSFIFKGETFNTVYARYILSYLKENRF